MFATRWRVTDRASVELAGMGPARQRVAVGLLGLAQHIRGVSLYRLHRDHQILGDLAVGVSAGEEPQHLKLTRSQRIQFRIQRRFRGIRSPGERIEHKSGQPRTEHRVATGHPAYRIGELTPEIVLVT